MAENFVSSVSSEEFDKALLGGLDAANGKFAKPEDIPPVPVQSVNGKTGNVDLIAADVGADPEGTAVDVVALHNVAPEAHNDIRLLIEGLASRLNALADSDDTTLDQMSEIVAYIKANKTLIDSITTSKVNVSDIINNLTTNVSNKPLSAAQGVILKGMIDSLSTGKLDVTAIADWAKAATKPSYTKNEVGLGNVDNVKQYSASNQPPYPVTSVNGKTGAVTVAVPEIVQATGDSESAVMSQKAVTDAIVKLGQLPAPEYAPSVESLRANGDTSKLYVLPDGYLYAYMQSEGGLVPNFTNKADPTAAYWKEGYRINSSMAQVEAENVTCTNWIPFKQGDIIRVVGMRLAVDGYSEGGELVTGTTGVGYIRFGMSANGTTATRTTSLQNNYPDAITVVDGVEIIDTGLITDSGMSSATHFCLCGILEGTSDEVIITVNEEITYSSGSVSDWKNTGIPYVASIPTDLIGIVGEGNVIYLTDNNLSSGTYTLKYGDETYETIGTITVE